MSASPANAGMDQLWWVPDLSEDVDMRSTSLYGVTLYTVDDALVGLDVPPGFSVTRIEGRTPSPTTPEEAHHDQRDQHP
jgi:hypothetical protein